MRGASLNPPSPDRPPRLQQVAGAPGEQRHSAPPPPSTTPPLPSKDSQSFFSRAGFERVFQLRDHSSPGSLFYRPWSHNNAQAQTSHKAGLLFHCGPTPTAQHKPRTLAAETKSCGQDPQTQAMNDTARGIPRTGCRGETPVTLLYLIL